MTISRIEELKEWLSDKRLDVVAMRSGLSRQTLYNIRSGKAGTTMATYETLEALMRTST